MAVEGLVGANLLVGVLNLVPGLPLDGGRVLKAVVWRVTGNVHRGTIVAGLGRPAGRARGAAAGRCSRSRCSAPPPDHHRLRARLRRRRVPVVRRHRGDGVGAAAPQAAAPGRRAPWPAVPSRCPADLPLAEAVRRAQEAEAGSIVTVTSRRRPGRRRQRGRPARHPRGPPALGRRLDGGAHPRRRALAPGRHRRGGPDRGDQPHARPRSTSWSRTTASVFGVLVDRGRRPGLPRTAR